MTTIRGASSKPSIRELERIEAHYDPERDYDDDRIEWLMATARLAMRDKR